MPRIGITSDIHVDVTPTNRAIVPHLVQAAEEANLDALIICGDVSPSLMHIARFLGAFETLSCRKFFIAGNHDVWVITFEHVTSVQKYRALNAICEACDFEHLAAGPAIIGGVGICGTMGWYDYSLGSDPEIPAEVYAEKRWRQAVWRDRDYARWEMSDIEQCQQFAAALRSQLAHLPENLPSILVATHHVPFRECIRYRGQMPWDFFTAFMGSTRIGDICLSDPRVTHVAFGHLHQRVSRLIGGIRAICSPIGYLVEPPAQSLEDYARSRLAVIEIGGRSEASVGAVHAPGRGR